MIKNQSLKPFNTFGIDVKAKSFSSFNNVVKLKELIKNTDSKRLILGGGSNILFTKDFDSAILKNEIKGIELISNKGDYSILKVGAGELWHEFVVYCIDNNLGGVENMSLIPGTVGAAPIQNIGAYGVEQKDVFEKLEALNIITGEIISFTKAECNFGYRDSYFKHHRGEFVITHVYYKLSNKNHQLNNSYGAIKDVLDQKGVSVPTIKEISDAVISIRESKLPNPKEIGNAGSFFKNPVISIELFNSIQLKFPDVKFYKLNDTEFKIPAGWMIEKLDWKGKRFDNYGVHINQALVLVNYGDSDGNDIKNLAFNIIQNVKDVFGIELEPEVNIL